MPVKLFSRSADMRFVLLTVLFAAAGARAGNSIPVRLDLVAIDQTTIPLVYEGAYDIYHVVVGSRLDSVFGLELDLNGLDLIETDFVNGELVRAGTDLQRMGAADFPYSFFVSGQPEPLRRFVLGGSQRTNDRIHGYYGAFGSPLFPGSGEGNADETTVAVLTVPAASPKPSLSGVLGAAYAADVIGIVPSTGPLPGDVNADRTVDLLDLDIGVSLYPFSNPGPVDIFDFNDDAVVDGKDVAIHSANYQQRLLPDPGLVQFFVVDATETEIAIDPGFFPGGPFDLLDLDVLGANFGQTRATVGQRDLNGDQVVDLLDLDRLGANFVSTSLAVPEPTALLLGALALAALPSRRRGD